MITNGSPFRGVIFDLDNTLYPKRSGLFAAIDTRINLYLRHKLGLSAEEAEDLRKRYRADYHITLCGLIREHGISPGDFLDFVHSVPVEEFLSPDPFLDGLLGSIPCPKHIFTNGSRDHARRVVRRLAVERHFTRIFDIASTGYTPKPEPEAFRLVLQAVDLEPERTVYVDDLLRNAEAAGALGITSILLNERALETDKTRYRVSDLPELASVLRTLLGAPSGD